MTNLLIAAGLLGFVFYAVAFALVQFGRLDGNSVTYTVLNIGAATFVLISLFEQFNLSALLIQATWIAVGFGGLIRRFTAGRTSALDTTSSRTPNARSRPSTRL